MGANVERTESSVIVKKSKLHGIDIDMNAMPDAAMTLVPLALYTDGPITIRNIASWRVKETDRIDAMVKEMSKLGVKVESGEDFISIDASSRNDVTPAFDTYNDHRMAMSMAPACLRTGKQIQINNPQVVSKSYPAFWGDLEKAGFEICR